MVSDPASGDLPGEKRYRIRLTSGRVLGPLDLRRIALLILKNQIVGEEYAQEAASGAWKKIMQYPALADLLIAKLEGRLSKKTLPYLENIVPEAGPGETQVLPPVTAVIPPVAASAPVPFPVPGPDATIGTPSKSLQLAEADPEIEATVAKKAEERGGPEQKIELDMTPAPAKGSNKKPAPGSSEPAEPEEEATQIHHRMSIGSFQEKDIGIRVAGRTEQVFELAERPSHWHSSISEQKTILFRVDPYRPGVKKKEPKGASFIEKLRASAIGAALGFTVYQCFLVPPPKTPLQKITIIRPRLPAQAGMSPDPQKSTFDYTEGVKLYLQDTVEGYRRAAEYFLASATLDPNNVKALAMLASSYLNLVDSSNKDENYFSVISKLIEMSRAKSVDLAETVIADVEFFIMANKAEAAQNRIVEYSRIQRNFPIDMYYYLAYTFYHRGDYRTAARYLSDFPDNKANSPKLFYLRGLLADQLSTPDEAVSELNRAVQMNPTHVKSRLKICEILDRTEHITDASQHLQYIIAHPQLTTAKELASAYFLYSKLKERLGQNEDALGEIEKAVNLDHANSSYLLQYYTLKAKTGASIASVQNKARMYYFMGEGEKLLMEAKTQDALSQFMQARDADYTSPAPLVRIGDIFVQGNDYISALMNYKKAAELSRKSVPIWSKYIEALIQNYEWQEAMAAMDSLRGVPEADSTIDKLAGDMYAKQGVYAQAIGYYRKAMGRETIEPDVYMAYAKALMAVKDYADAPLFFALALRFDPLNMEAIVGTANAIAQTDSIDKAMHMIQDEVQKARYPHAELYAAMAALEIQKGDWLSAQQSVNQAIETNADYPGSYQLRAQIYLNQYQNGGLKPKDAQAVLDQALGAYRAYSDRNPSDPSGYLEGFRLLAERGQYGKAQEELERVYALFPKYPSLHLLRGNLYLATGDHNDAFKEYEAELSNNPNHVDALLAIGKEYIFLGKNQDAMNSFTKAMSIAPQAAEPKHWAGYANFLLKNYPGAIALYQTAIQLDAGNPMIYKRLGFAYQLMGNGPEAAQAFKKYMELAPDAPDRAQFERFQ